MVEITGNYARRIKSWVNSKIAAIVLSSLADVDDTDKSNNKILVWKAASSKHEYKTQSGGVTDHGALTGLADDDHPQYTQDAEVDAILAVHTAIAAAHHAKYTDAEVDAIVATHTAIASAHHVKYTNAEAVAAVIAGDNYIKNDADDETTGTITADGYRRMPNGIDANTILFQYSSASKDIDTKIGSSGLRLYKWHTHQSGLVNWSYKARGSRASPAVPILDDKLAGMGGGLWDGDSWVSGGQMLVKVDGTITTTSTPTRVTIDTCPVGSQIMVERMAILNDGKIDVKNNIIKDQKNHEASALSGTKKLIEIDIGGVAYYFEVSPTKA